MEKRLEEKVILVTGAGKGIGKTLSKVFAKEGATVLLLGKEQSDLEATYDEIVADGGPEPAIMVVDLGEPGSDPYKTVGLAIAQNFEKLDGIVHNAAYLGQLMSLADLDEMMWSHILQVNLNAAFDLTKQCFSMLESAPTASVVFTAEESGRKAKGYWGAYGVSKAALIHMARTWAIENQKTSIRMNIVDPGPCRTGLRLLTHPGLPIRSYPPAETITEIYVKLMSAEGTQYNGELFDARDWFDESKDDRTEEEKMQMAEAGAA